TARLVLTCVVLAPALIAGSSQGTGLDSATLLAPLADSWPTYSGDLTGRRYSTLTQINKANVRNLSLAWAARGFVEGSGAAGRNAVAGRGGGASAYPLIVSGLGSGEYNTGGPAAIRGSIVMVDGVLYATSPDNVWAVDARDGSILWQYYWKTRG